jgi:hypothetical protein
MKLAVARMPWKLEEICLLAAPDRACCPHIHYFTTIDHQALMHSPLGKLPLSWLPDTSSRSMSAYPLKSDGREPVSKNHIHGMAQLGDVFAAPSKCLWMKVTFQRLVRRKVRRKVSSLCYPACRALYATQHIDRCNRELLQRLERPGPWTKSRF